MRKAVLVTAWVLCLGLWPCTANGTPVAVHAPEHWVASWTMSPTDGVTPLDPTFTGVTPAVGQQSYRMIITPHLSGSVVRVRLTNRFGLRPLVVRHVTVAEQRVGSGTSPPARVTFGGSRSIKVPVGRSVASDPIHFAVRAFEPCAVSLFVSSIGAGTTQHWNANATSYYSLPLSGDATANTSGAPFVGTTQSWFYVDGLDVEAPAAVHGIVAFGDSITDGWVGENALSVPVDRSVANKNGRYPDYLQRRLIKARLPLSVVNAGISGNRILQPGLLPSMGPSGLSRFQADVLDQPGVVGVIILEGINDLGLPPKQATAAQVIAGLTQLVEDAHHAGIKAWLGTLTPASDAILDGDLTAPDSEASRQQINQWIRKQSIANGVIDFDAAVRDPANPAIMQARLSSPDRLHPNLAGYRAMADAVPLALFKGL